MNRLLMLLPLVIRRDMTCWWTPAWVDRQLGDLQMPTRRQFLHRLKQQYAEERWVALGFLAWVIAFGVLSGYCISFAKLVIQQMQVSDESKSAILAVLILFAVLGVPYVGLVACKLLSRTVTCRNLLRCFFCGAQIPVDDYQAYRRHLKTNACRNCDGALYTLDADDHERIRNGDVPILASLKRQQATESQINRYISYGLIVVIVGGTLLFFHIWPVIAKGKMPALLLIGLIPGFVMLRWIYVQRVRCWNCRGPLHCKELDKNCPNCGMPLSREAASKEE